MSKYEDRVLYHTSDERRKETLQEEAESNFQPVKIDLKEYALAPGT
jgi:hypothetical protein